MLLELKFADTQRRLTIDRDLSGAILRQNARLTFDRNKVLRVYLGYEHTGRKKSTYTCLSHRKSSKLSHVLLKDILFASR